MRVYLVRHGKARPKEEDPDRSLSDKGQAEVDRVAGFLAQTDVVRSLPILHSGKTRARQTAEGLARAFEGARVEEVEGLAPLDDPAVWAGRLDGPAEGIVLVGHLPHLARLTSLLLTGDPDRETVRFSNAGIRYTRHWARSKRSQGCST